MKSGVGLNDDVLMCGLLEFVDEHGLAGLERFGDFGCTRKVRFGESVLAVAILRASFWIS